MSRWSKVILAAALAILASACEERPADLREWTAEDHDHQKPARGGRGRNTNTVTKDTRAAPSERNMLVEVTWSKQCASCHGRRGRGDGPQSAMVKARDLTAPEWQASVTDEALAKVIREGKDKMPAFNLPDRLVQDLVAHVRGMQRKPRQKPGEEDEAQTGDEAEAEPATAPASATTPPSPPAEAPKSAAPAGSAAPER